MRILTRYVLSEMLKVFLVSLAGITLIILLFVLVAEAIKQGLGLKQIILVIPYVLPNALRFSVPATILFGACNVFGRLASGNEVIAVKASGISPMVLIWPALVLALVVSWIAVWLNDIAVSWGREGIARVVIESFEEIAYSRLQQQGSFSSKQFSMFVKEVDGRRLIRPRIIFQGNDDSPQRTLTCDEAEMRSDLSEGTLKMICRNSQMTIAGWTSTDSGVHEFEIPLDDSSRKGLPSPSDLPMHALPEQRLAQQARIASLEQQLAAKAACQMIGGDFTALLSPRWKEDERQLVEAKQWLYRANAESYRRWANGFSCLCFVIVGAPLAVRMRNADFLTSFFLCFAPILIVYYPLLIYSTSQTKNGTFPSWGVWAGNAILVVIGWRLMRYLCRY
jgi:lipopolysaccharide export system permease protein